MIFLHHGPPLPIIGWTYHGFSTRVQLWFSVDFSCSVFSHYYIGRTEITCKRGCAFERKSYRDRTLGTTMISMEEKYFSFDVFCRSTRTRWVSVVSSQSVSLSENFLNEKLGQHKDGPRHKRISISLLLINLLER